MTQPQKHVVFDVVGTCVSFDAFYERVDKVLGAKLRDHTINAQHFGFTWQSIAELEYTFLSVSETYKPYKEVMNAIFYRTLGLCGVPNPRQFATDAERDECMDGYASLQLRDDCLECFRVLRESGFTVWCFTAGDIQRVRGYFERAGVDMPIENFLSCDSVGVAKPALPAYASVWKQLGAADVKWFAAAHMWDVTAATKVGFRGAWSACYEKEACLDVFSDRTLEVVAQDLVGMAKEIVAKS